MNKTVLVTGASGVIGKAIALHIAKDPGYEVVLICRDEKRAKNDTEDVKSASGNEHITYQLADLSLKSSIQDLATRIKKPVHALVNNAAVCPSARIETAEGIEMQFATNVLGYLWMTSSFTDHLKESDGARIVNVASYYAGGLDVNDLEFKQRNYDNNAAYRQSKQANRMLTLINALLVDRFNITVNACHPGDVNSKLSNDLGFGGSTSAEQGADTPAWLATSKEVEGLTGKYFSGRQEDHCEFSDDDKAIEKLYEVCMTY